MWTLLVWVLFLVFLSVIGLFWVEYVQRIVLTASPKHCLNSSVRIAVEWTLRFLTSPLRVKPTVCVVGFQRSGTTALWEFLKQHSRVLTCPWKESCYFSGGFYGASATPFGSLYAANFPTIFEKWLRMGFANPVCIDFDTRNIRNPWCANRIQTANSNMKIIVLIRNYKDALKSNLKWFSDFPNVDGYTPFSIEEFDHIMKDAKFWEHYYSLVDLSPHTKIPIEVVKERLRCASVRCFDNFRLIEPYTRNFPKQNILVVEFEKLVSADNASTLQNIQNFLGLNDHLDPKLFQRQLKSKTTEEHNIAWNELTQWMKFEEEISGKQRFSNEAHAGAPSE